MERNWNQGRLRERVWRYPPDDLGAVSYTHLDVYKRQQEPITKGVEVIVTATPDEGYKFSAESVTQWTFEWSDIEVTPAAPTFNDSTGVITIPSETGCIYKIGDTALVAGPQAVSYTHLLVKLYDL